MTTTPLFDTPLFGVPAVRNAAPQPPATLDLNLDSSDAVPEELAFLATHGVVSGDGRNVTLNAQITPDLYRKVATALERLGGRYVNKGRGHAFTYDVTALYQAMLERGEVPEKNPTAFFPTPQDLVEDMLKVADLMPGLRVLEPSAGTGAIARALREAGCEPDCCEVLGLNRTVLQRDGFTLVAEDFLTYAPGPVYDRVVMNPPFSLPGDRSAWRTHVLHALEMLHRDGVVVAVVPRSMLYGDDRASTDFRTLIALHGEFEALPDGSFSESGTDVKTMLLTLHKAEWRTQPHAGWPSWGAFETQNHIENEPKFSARVDLMGSHAIAGKPFDSLLRDVQAFALKEGHPVHLTEADRAALRAHQAERQSERRAS